MKKNTFEKGVTKFNKLTALLAVSTSSFINFVVSKTQIATHLNLKLLFVRSSTNKLMVSYGSNFSTYETFFAKNRLDSSKNIML